MNPFIDIGGVVVDQNTGKIAGSPFLENVNSIQMGAGNTGMRMAVQKGLWFGAKNFDDATFSVDMNGNLVLRIAGGGTAGITISAQDKTIIVNDGVVDRILIGYLAGKF